MHGWIQTPLWQQYRSFCLTTSHTKTFARSFLSHHSTEQGWTYWRWDCIDYGRWLMRSRLKSQVTSGDRGIRKETRWEVGLLEDNFRSNGELRLSISREGTTTKRWMWLNIYRWVTLKWRRMTFWNYWYCWRI